MIKIYKGQSVGLDVFYSDVTDKYYSYGGVETEKRLGEEYVVSTDCEIDLEELKRFYDESVTRYVEDYKNYKSILWNTLLKITQEEIYLLEEFGAMPVGYTNPHNLKLNTVSNTEEDNTVSNTEEDNTVSNTEEDNTVSNTEDIKGYTYKELNRDLKVHHRTIKGGNKYIECDGLYYSKEEILEYVLKNKLIKLGK